MYSKEEASKIKQEFWTTIGRYISPIPSADGLKINWINYKTGIKSVSIKLEAERDQASIGFYISHVDTALQELFFLQFETYRTILHEQLQEEWDWVMHTSTIDGRVISKISKTLTPVNIYDKADWPMLIAFFKPRIIALDEFWSLAKYGFEGL